MFREYIFQPLNLVYKLVYAISLHALSVQNQPGEDDANTDQPSHLFFHARNVTYRYSAWHRANLGKKSRNAVLHGATFCS